MHPCAMLAIVATARLPLAARVGVAFLAVLALVAVGGATAVVQYGAGALWVGDGDEVSTRATARTWFGLGIENPSAVPVTLRSVRGVRGSNVRVLETRVLDHTLAGGGIAALSPPLPASAQADVDHSSPVDGFVVPARTRDRYQLIVLIERVRPGAAAVLRESDVRYTALGLDHGFRSHAVVCIRAPGTRDCPRP